MAKSFIDFNILDVYTRGRPGSGLQTILTTRLGRALAERKNIDMDPCWAGLMWVRIKNRAGSGETYIFTSFLRKYSFTSIPTRLR